jgi:hypothetical protein
MKGLQLLLLCLISVPTYSQSEVYHRELDYQLDNSLVKHNLFPNGDRISVFTSTANGSDLLSILKKNELTGQTSQTDVLIDEFIYSTVFGVITYSDNSYLIALQHQGSNVSQILLKFASDNSLLWKERIFLPNATQPYYYNEVLDNGQGGAYMMISEAEFSGILNINSDGSILWGKSITGTNSNGKSPGFSICRNNSGGVNGTLKDESYQCVFSLNDQGAEIWSKSHVDWLYRWPKRIIQTNNSKYITGGTLYDDLNSIIYPYVTIYSSVGEIELAKKINLLNYELWDIQESSDGSLYALVGESTSNTFGIVKMDANLNVLTTKMLNNTFVFDENKFINQQNNLGLDVRLSAEWHHTYIDFNGDLNALCGTIEFNGVYSVDDTDLLQSTISEGILINNLSPQILNDFTITFPPIDEIIIEDLCNYVNLNEIPLVTESITIYPNPASDYFILDLHDKTYTEINLHDLNGKPVKAICTSCSGTFDYEIDELKQGVYFVSFKNDQETIIEKIIIH